MKTSSPSIEGLGLDPNIGWYLGSFFFLVGSVGTWILTTTIENPTEASHARLIALFALLASPSMLIGVYLRASERWLHIPVLIGFAAILTVGLAARSVADSLLPFITVATILPSYLLRPRSALPYIAIGTILTALLAAISNAPDPAARAIIVGGTLLGVTLVVLFAQERVRAVVRENKVLSGTDTLTGVANMRRFRDVLAHEVPRANRTGSAIALFEIDLDDFKAVNDQFDHSLGDQVLVEATAAIHASLRPGDLLARRGGDEFIVLALGYTPEELAATSERLKQYISMARSAVCPEINPDASVACTVYRPGESADAWINRLDNELHTAKLAAHPERKQRDRSRAASTDANGGISANMPDAQQPEQTATALTDTAAAALRVEQPEIDLKRAWEVFGAMLFAFSVAVTALGVSGVSPDLRDTSVLIGALAASGMALATVQLRQIKSPLALMCFVLLGFGLLTVSVENAGAARLALIDLYLLPPLVLSYFIAATYVVPLAATCLIPYVYFSLETTGPKATSMLIINLSIFVTAWTLIAVSRRHIGKFVELNVTLAGVDPLTGIANLRRLKSRLGDEVRRSTALGGGVTLLMLDLDNFKQVNDRFSHTVGDAVLVAVARAIENVVRTEELAARRGGDEFAIIATHPMQGGSVEVLEQRLLAAVAEARNRVCPSVTPTAGIGSAEWSAGDTVEQLLKRADEALHVAKELGRRSEGDSNRSAALA